MSCETAKKERKGEEREREAPYYVCDTASLRGIRVRIFANSRGTPAIFFAVCHGEGAQVAGRMAKYTPARAIMNSRSVTLPLSLRPCPLALRFFPPPRFVHPLSRDARTGTGNDGERMRKREREGEGMEINRECHRDKAAESIILGRNGSLISRADAPMRRTLFFRAPRRDIMAIARHTVR